MPRVVPSQVIAFIDQVFPWAARQAQGEHINLHRGQAGQLAALLDLLENVPDELITVRTEQRCFTDEEMRQVIAAAPEWFGTIVAVTAILGLRIGETLGLRVSDVDFDRRLIRVRQSADSATRKIAGVKSRASSADMPMPKELEARLHLHLSRHDRKSELLFPNRNGRPFSADKLREKQLHPLLNRLGIPRGGFHSMRHGAASALLADGASPALVQKQLRHSDPRLTLAVYAHVLGDQQRTAVQNRSTRLVN